MGRRWWGGGRRRSWGSSWGNDWDGDGWGNNTKKPKKSKSKPAAWRSAFDYLPNLDEPLDLLGLTQGRGPYGGITVHTPRNNALIDLELGENIPDFDDELDHEVLYGTVKGEIVGLQYYKGMVNNKEMVSLQREPHNRFDANAVKVMSAMGDQVGHIKRELAKALAWIMDNGKARVEGIVPRGAGQMFKMPVELSFWGQPENRDTVNAHLRRHGYYLDTSAVPTPASQGAVPGTSMGTNRLMVSRTQLSSAKMAEQLDGLFSSLDEVDKTKEMEPTEGISTTLFAHQKQALSWMVEKENTASLPPFWKVVNGGMFYNSLTNFCTNKRPDSVTGGILADDMGLGKTLEVIALILTNFVGNKPLAVKVPGMVRPSKIAKEERIKAYRKAMEEENSDTEDYDPRKPRHSKGVKKKLNIKAEAFVVPEEEVYKPKKTARKSSMAKEKVESSETEEEMTESDTTDSELNDEGNRVVMIDSSDPEYVPEGLGGKGKSKAGAGKGKGKAGPAKGKAGPSKGKSGPTKGKAGPSNKHRPKRSKKSRVINYDDGSSSDGCEIIETCKQTYLDPKLPETPADPAPSTPQLPTVTGSGEPPADPAPNPPPLPTVAGPGEPHADPAPNPPPLPTVAGSDEPLAGPAPKPPPLPTAIPGDYVIPQLDGACDETAGGRPKRKARKPNRYMSEEEGSPRKKAKLEPKRAAKATKPLHLTSSQETNPGPAGPLATRGPAQGKTAGKGKAPTGGAAKGRATKVGKENAKTPVVSPVVGQTTPVAAPVVAPALQGAPVVAPAHQGAPVVAPALQGAIGLPTGGVNITNTTATSSTVVAPLVAGSSQVNKPEVVKPGALVWHTAGLSGQKPTGTTASLISTAIFSTLNPTAPVFVPASAKPQPIVVSGSQPLSVAANAPAKVCNTQARMSSTQARSSMVPVKSRHFKSAASAKGVAQRASSKRVKVSRKKRNQAPPPALPCMLDSDSDDLPDLSQGDLARSSDPMTLDAAAMFDPLAGSSSSCDIPNKGRTQTTEARGTLIVCPLSVLSNWLDQLEDHVDPSVLLEVYTYYGSGRTKNPKVLAEQDIVLTTYATLANDAKGKNPLGKVEWLRLVLDEGHTIRNPNAQQTKAILAIKAKRKWVLTGTPIQNSMKDLYSIVNFLGIAPLNDRQMWLRTIERPILQGDESAFKRVQQLMKSVAMRRLKTQEMNGKPLVTLPEKKVFIETLKLTEEERKVYDSMANEGKIIVSRYFRQGTLLHHYGEVLAILMRLRQICCHPFLVAKAAKAMTEIVDSAEKSVQSSTPEELRKQLVAKVMEVMKSGSDEECSICLDPLRAPVITHCAHLFCRPCIELVIRNDQLNARCPLCRGEVKQDQLVEVPPDSGETEEEDFSGPWQSSAKVDALLRGLVALRAEDKTIKSLVVSQFTSFLNILEKPLSENGFKYVRLDGTMSSKQRMAAMEAFSDPNPSSPTIFLMSLKAGGVGLNLVAASRVFLMEPAWNPASEEQCFDRCHRLGQTREVIVTKYVIEDSVEGRMLELQEKKRSLMNGAFGQKQTAEEKRRARINDLKTLMDI